MSRLALPAPHQPYPGDADLDGSVTVLDLLWVVGEYYGSTRGDAYYDPAGDFDGNKTIDVIDLLILTDTFGTTFSGDTCDSLRSGPSHAGSEAIDLPGGSYTMEELQAMDEYEVLEATGLLDAYLEYLAEHPEYASQ